MRILIVGGSGGVSGELARQAVALGYEVYAVTRGIRPLPNGVIPVIADRNNHEEFLASIEALGVSFDAVFDCICMTGENARQDIEAFERITERLIVISTDSVYDPHFKKIPQDENGIFIEDDGKDGKQKYGADKRRMEKEFISYMKNAGSMKITLFRPGHILGKGFLPGCFPENSRQKELPSLILAGEPLHLVGLGTFIIQPIAAKDLARVMLDSALNEKTFNQIFAIGGPDAVECRTYYEILGELLGKKPVIKEVVLEGYLEDHPEYYGHLCHRYYDLSKLKATGIKLPDTSLRDMLAETLNALEER